MSAMENESDNEWGEWGTEVDLVNQHNNNQKSDRSPWSDDDTGKSSWKTKQTEESGNRRNNDDYRGGNDRGRGRFTNQTNRGGGRFSNRDDRDVDRFNDGNDREGRTFRSKNDSTRGKFNNRNDRDGDRFNDRNGPDENKFNDRNDRGKGRFNDRNDREGDRFDDRNDRCKVRFNDRNDNDRNNRDAGRYNNRNDRDTGSYYDRDDPNVGRSNNKTDRDRGRYYDRDDPNGGRYNNKADRDTRRYYDRDDPDAGRSNNKTDRNAGKYNSRYDRDGGQSYIDYDAQNDDNYSNGGAKGGLSSRQNKRGGGKNGMKSGFDDDDEWTNDTRWNQNRNNDYDGDKNTNRRTGDRTFRNKRNDDSDGQSRFGGDNKRDTRGPKSPDDDDFCDKFKGTSLKDDDEAPKRATYDPNDDEEDYYLHVNSGINFSNYSKIPVDVTGEDVPPALDNFSDLVLPDFVSQNIEALNYTTLTPVQKHAIPIISAHRDLMSCAQTGSGKTFAFLFPIINELQSNVQDDTETDGVVKKTVFPKALIMAPTRELCRQIYTAARQLCQGSKLRCSYVYGGIEMNRSRRNLLETGGGGCDILVATPGRLLHFLELVWISLKYVRFLVLDEADRMLDTDGFNDAVNKVYKETRMFADDEDEPCQVSMFSATFPPEIQELARLLLRENYLFLVVGVVGGANSDVHQEILQADMKQKMTKAVEYIKSNIQDEKCLVFVDTKRMADFLGIKLGYVGLSATTIHGDRDQQQREQALNDFKSGRVKVMVATNVAARGLDIPKVDVVVNVDMPNDIDTYVHRIGRTGRCGNVGRAVSFFEESRDIGLSKPLVQKLEEAGQPVPDWLSMLASSALGQSAPTRKYRDTRNQQQHQRHLANNGNDTNSGWGDSTGWKDDDGGFMQGTNVNYAAETLCNAIGAKPVTDDNDGWASE